MDPISLKAIADKMEEASEEWQCYLNKDTGEFVDVQVEHLGIAEELDEGDDLSKYADWERDGINRAIEILENWDSYKRLPTQYDIHEYNIMRDFAYSQTDERNGARLENALSGSGAFRRFKDAVRNTDIDDSWYDFRADAFLTQAKEWCEHNNIPYKD